MRTRATSSGTGRSPDSVALSDVPVVETVTLRAPVASPMRMTGSVVMWTGSDSISGMGAGSLSLAVGHVCVVGVGGAVCVVCVDGVIARRGLVAGCCESCALSLRDGEMRAQQSRVATNIFWMEERIGLCAHVKRGKEGRGARCRDSTIDLSQKSLEICVSTSSGGRQVLYHC
ncbi:MAG: hypothetical protein QOC61_1963 [Acidobacteriota bacterium]|nr:hypothetical protein [Acidobacteriota bacterium]